MTKAQLKKQVEEIRDKLDSLLTDVDNEAYDAPEKKAEFFGGVGEHLTTAIDELDDIITECDEKLKDNITMVKVGDVCSWKHHDGSKVATTVLPKCKLNSGIWFCKTHKRLFAHQLEKDGHVSQGQHELAWYCSKHGMEVP